MSRYLWRQMMPARQGEEMPTRAERQRQWRQWQREKGYRRLDIWIGPKLWEKLRPHLDERFRDTHPGACIVQLLEELEIHDSGEN